MTKHNILHLLTRAIPYGAYGMLCELYYAINKYYPECTQEVVILKERTLKYDYGSEVGMNVFSICQEDIVEKLKKYDNPIVIAHNIATTNLDKLSSHFYKKFPLAVINHTQKARFDNIPKCDVVICVSKYMKKTMSLQLPKIRTVFIRNGVNAKRYESIDPIKRGSNYFYTGRMNSFNGVKHPQDWIEYVHRLKTSKPLWHDYLGGGAYYDEAKKRLKSLEKRSPSENKIILHNKIENFEKKVSIIKSWDCFFYQINSHEGTSMSILESMACGIPVICSNHYGNKEIVKNDVNGYVFDTRKKAFKYIHRLCDNSDILEEIKISTKKYFDEHLDAKHTARKYMKLFDEM